MVAGPVALILALELLFLGWKGSSLARLTRPGASELIDLGMFIIGLLGLMPTLQLLMSLGATRPIAMTAHWLLALGPHLGSGILAALGYFLLSDLIGYWVHRAFHSRWLWPLHSLHHSAETISPLTVHRSNPLEQILAPLTAAVPLALLGAPAWAVWGYAAFWSLNSPLCHSALRWHYGWAGRWLFYSPLAHRLHHSHDPQFYNCNYGGILVLWDRLFGSWADPRHVLQNSVTMAIPPAPVPPLLAEVKWEPAPLPPAP